MNFKHIFTALAATLSMIAITPDARANDSDSAQQTSSQRTLVAQASAKIVSATTFTFSSTENTEQNADDFKVKEAGRSEIVRECGNSTEKNTPAQCADMRIIDLH